MSIENTNLFFSIGIPAWKTSFLNETIESVLCQTYENFELIIVNDASPYPVDEFVKSYNDERIRYYCNEKNYGARNMVDNWNKCLNYARGSYFLLLGDDDRLEPDCLEEFAALIDRMPGLNVYHCRAGIINESSELIGYTESRPEFENVYDAIWHRIRGFRGQYISDYVYQREVLTDMGGFYKLPMGWASDDISCYRAMIGQGMAHTQKPVFSYRQNAASMSSSGSVYLKLEAIRGERNWFEEFLLNEPLEAESKITHQNIKHYLPDYIRKKQVGTLALWARWVDLLRFRELNKLGVDFKSLLFSVALKIKFCVIGAMKRRFAQ